MNPISAIDRITRSLSAGMLDNARHGVDQDYTLLVLVLVAEDRTGIVTAHVDCGDGEGKSYVAIVEGEARPHLLTGERLETYRFAVRAASSNSVAVSTPESVARDATQAREVMGRAAELVGEGTWWGPK